MFKSSKKSATRVDASPVPSKPLKKGKREAEEITEKPTNLKKKKDIKEAIQKKKAEVKTVKKKKVETSSSSDDNSSSSDSEKEQKDTDVEMVDAGPAKKQDAQPKTLTTPKVQSSGSKTLFVGNLPSKLKQADLENFFKNVGKVVDVHFPSNPEAGFRGEKEKRVSERRSKRGQINVGYGYVTFATAEEAQKALQLNGQELKGGHLMTKKKKKKGGLFIDMAM